MTTVRLGLVGDSHSAAIHAGWKSLRHDLPDVSLDMFAAPGDSFRTVKMVDGMLVARKRLRKSWLLTGGADRMHVAQYDGLVMCGFGTNANRHVAVLKTHSVKGRRKTAQPMSDAALQETLYDRLQTSSGGRIARWLRDQTDGPIFWLQTPRTTRRWLSAIAPPWLPRTVQESELEAFFRAADEAVRHLATRYRIELLRQPSETLEGPCFSATHYARDNDAFAWLKKTGIDTVHMNGDYGALVLRTHLSTILRAARTRAASSSPERAELVEG